MPKVVDQEERRRELTAALWRIVDRGVLTPVGIRDIAAAAGVSVGLVQHYFPSKEDLLRHAQAELQEDFDRRFQMKIAGLANPSPEVLRIFMFERLPLSKRDRTRGRMLLAWLTQVSWRPEWDGQVAALQRSACEAMTEALRVGQTQGRVAGSVDPVSAAYGLFALNEGLCAGLLNGLHTPAEAKQIMEYHLEGLIADGEQ